MTTSATTLTSFTVEVVATGSRRACIRTCGRLDGETVVLLESVVAEQTANGVTRLEIDAHRVGHIDCTALERLRAYRLCAAAGIRLDVRGIRPDAVQATRPDSPPDLTSGTEPASRRASHRTPQPRHPR